MNEDEEVSLHDELAAAFKEVSEREPTEESAATTDESKSTEQTTDEEKARDEQGRFKAKEEPGAEEGQQSGEKQDPTTPVLNEDKAPSGWAPKFREQWSGLPKEIREEILRREEASVRGVRQLQEESSYLKDFANPLVPFIKEASSAGIHPGEYIASVMQAEHILRTGDVESKFATLLDIADKYGVPLRKTLESLGEDIAASLPAQKQQVSLPPEIQRELEESRRFRQQFGQQQETEAMAELRQFAAENEFFEDVHLEMADIMERGGAKTLKEAYERAIWSNPMTREVLLSRQMEERKKEELKNKQAKAASLDMSGSGEVSVRKKNDENSTIEDDLRDAWNQHVSSRT